MVILLKKEKYLKKNTVDIDTPKERKTQREECECSENLQQRIEEYKTETDTR